MTQLPSFDLTGKIALVTGAARGLGRAISLALAAAGADVALGLRDKSSDSGLAKEIEKLGRRALPLQMDCTEARPDHPGHLRRSLRTSATSTSSSTTSATASRPWPSTSPNTNSTPP